MIYLTIKLITTSDHRTSSLILRLTHDIS